MRIFLFAILVMLSCQVSSNAQFEYEIGTTWTYSRYEWFFNRVSSVSVTLTRDSIINDKRWFYPETIEGCSSFYNGVYIRKDQDRVYYYDPLDNTENLLYDFSLQPGESWVINNRNEQPVTATVDSIGTIQIGDTTLRIQYINYVDLGRFVIEGIGSNDYLVPANGVCDPAFYGIRCVSSGSLFLDFDFEHDCDEVILNVSTSNEVIQELQVYPNPSNDYIEFGEIFHNASISIWNIAGNRIQFEKKLNGKSTDISRLKNGLYYGSLTQGDKIFSFRFVKN